MKTFFTLLFSIVVFTTTAQHTVMPAATKAAIQVIQKDLKQNRNLPSAWLQNRYPIYKHNGGYVIALICKTTPAFSKQAAIENGFDVGAVIRNIATVRVPLEDFTNAFYYNGIEYAEVAEKIEPFLNGALVDTRADSVHMGINLPQPFTGKDVLIGIADWGFDYTHPAFYDTTLTQNRIRAAWDQVKIVGTPPAGFSHGAVYTDTAQLAAAESDTFSITSDYHGTHVAGICGGSGGGTVYKGVGFESDLLFSQMRSDASSSLDAFQWMYNISKADGKRLVINNSWGGYRTNPLDGTSLISQAIDAYSDSGVVFVFSAANNGTVNFHLKKTFNNDSLRTRITGFSYATDTLLWGQGITMWGDAGNNFSTQLRILSGTNVLLGQSLLYNTATAPAFTDTFLVAGSDTVWYNFTVEDAHPLNGRPHVTLDVKCTNLALKCVLFAQASSGILHCWNTRLTIFGGGNWGYAFNTNGTGYVSGDKNYGIGHPGVTTSVITAAAHVTNAGIASFSSYGPRMDEVQKPDISAPGSAITSAMNSFSMSNLSAVTSVTFNGKQYDFVQLSGTSMSGPMVAGVVSLLLEANPFLQPYHAKEIIKNSARTDGYTGTIPVTGSVRWGWGKINAYKAMNAVMAASVEPVGENAAAWTVYPNPATYELFVTGELDGTETYRLMATDGKLLAQEKLQGAIDITSLSAGMYVLVIENIRGISTYRVIVER